jgi:sarcosine oxidase, subunit beta
VAIVGAGIMGLSVAFHLLERSPRRIVIYERRGIGAEASGVQPGGVRQQWSTLENCLLARESYFFYRDLAIQLDGPVRPVLEECGYLFVAESESYLAELRRHAAVQRRAGVPTEILTPVEAAERAPALDPSHLVGAAFCAEDGYFDRPQAVVEAFAEAAQRRGAEIEYADVVEIAPNGGGWDLCLGDGRRARADRVVAATGYGTPAVLRSFDVAAPIVKEARHLFFSDPVRERLLEPLLVAAERRFAAKHLADGRVLASDLSARGDADLGRERWRRRVRENIAALVPLLEFVSLPLLVTGYYDVTPDHQAIVDAVPGSDGVWVAAGFSGHGFMMAPAIGRSLAAAVDGEPLDHRFEPLRLARFARPEFLRTETQVV